MLQRLRNKRGEITLVIAAGIVLMGHIGYKMGYLGKCGKWRVDSAVTHYNIDTMEKTYTIFPECNEDTSAAN